MKASIRELRTASKLIVSEVARGNSVIMTYHGQDFAKIIPLKKGKKKPQKEDPAFGMWQDNKKVKSVKKFIKSVREERK